MSQRDRLIATAEAAADHAGAVIRPWFRAAALLAESKSDRSPVTAADRDAERAIRDTIAAREPGHDVLGEEFGRSGNTAARHCWIVDPIDGTRAFITGRPTFGTLIALLEDGEPLLGLIDQPVTGERWIGYRGEPTRFRGSLGGTPGARRCPDLARAELSATSPSMFDPGTARRFDRLAASVRRTSWGGDCYAYGLLALGQIDIVAEASMKPWDWAALVPVVEGAGGRLTDWEGRRPALDGTGEVLAVGDKALLQPALQLLAAREQGAEHEKVTMLK